LPSLSIQVEAIDSFGLLEFQKPNFSIKKIKQQGLQGQISSSKEGGQNLQFTKLTFLCLFMLMLQHAIMGFANFLQKSKVQSIFVQLQCLSDRNVCHTDFGGMRVCVRGSKNRLLENES
jgi:hypothetical protein